MAETPPLVCRLLCCDTGQALCSRRRPCAEIRPGFEAFQHSISTQERLLDHIVRIRLIAGYAKSDPKKTMAMAQNECPIGLFISIEFCMDRLVVVLAHAVH
jgi:hypothetical protein